jgi:hypothetical protein
VKFAKVFILAIGFGCALAPEGENRRPGKNPQWYSGPRRGKFPENPCYFKAFGGVTGWLHAGEAVRLNRVLSEEEGEEMKEMKGIKDEKR